MSYFRSQQNWDPANNFLAVALSIAVFAVSWLIAYWIIPGGPEVKASIAESIVSAMTFAVVLLALWFQFTQIQIQRVEIEEARNESSRQLKIQSLTNELDARAKANELLQQLVESESSRDDLTLDDDKGSISRSQQLQQLLDINSKRIFELIEAIAASSEHSWLIATQPTKTSSIDGPS